tara:strand:+ start:1391 stop:1657 length:267 start_codon:yes stop_codon:yes gene_type:complete
VNTTRARESFVVVVARTRIIEKERERERFYLRDEKDALNPGVASRRTTTTTTTTTTTKETFPRVALLRGVGDFPPEEEEEEEEDESPL